MPNTDTLQISRALFGTGQLLAAEWSGFVTAFPEATAVWADLEGMHRGPLPQTVPEATTHLWFWRCGCEGRVRIDETTWVAGVLADEGVSLPAECRLTEAELVVDVTRLRAWGEDWGPVKQRRGDPAAWEPLAQLVPRRSRTAVFLTDPIHMGWSTTD